MLLSWRRHLIHLLDRPGGRTLLSFLATRYARRLAGDGAAILYDQGWLHRVDGVAFPDGPRFRFDANQIANWRERWRRLQDQLSDYWFVLYRPRPGDVVIDVGAGVGWDTLLFSRAVGPAGRVLAIEAHPRTFDRLAELCRLNRLHQTICLQRAVIARSGTVFIEDQEDHEANRVFSQGHAEATIAVPGTSLDELACEHALDRVDFLKMNIEGAEREAIAGMSDLIERTRHVVIACHDFRAEDGEGEAFRSRETVIDFLRRHDFEILTRDDDPRPYVRDHVHARRREGRARMRS